MSYHGGLVQHGENDYFIYWAPSNYTIPDQTDWTSYKSGLTTWLNDVAGADRTSGNVFGVATQYFDTVSGATDHIPYAVHDSGAIVATDPLPSPPHCIDSGTSACITDADAEVEINAVVSAHGLPRNPDTEYFLFTPQGVGSCIDGSSTACAYSYYCGYHAAFATAAGPVVYAEMPWSYKTSECDANQAIPLGYPTAGAPAIDPEVGVLSHEAIETMTDVFGQGWYGVDYGDEIGDKCAYNYNGNSYGGTTGLSSGTNSLGNYFYNQTIGGDRYIMQTEFSNAASDGTNTGCVPSSPPGAVISGIPVGARLTGTPIPVDGSASTTPNGTTSYAWHFGDGAGSTAAAPTHTYARSGTYTITLTVSDGSHSYSKAAPVTISDRPPFAAFSTSGRISGRSIGFDGSGSSDPDGHVVSYAWSFGDGGLGSGAAPTHIYAAPGTYTVTLTVTDDSGSSAQVARRLTIYAPPRITGVKRRSRGRILQIGVSGPGIVSIGSHRRRLGAAGSVRLRVPLSRAQRARLARHHPVRVKVKIKFASVAGPTVVKTYTDAVKP
jgi:PKD repeat protein